MILKKIISIVLTIFLSIPALAGDYWIESNNGISDLSISSIAINSNDDVFAANWGTGVWLSQDNGANWSQVNNGIELNVIELSINSQGVIFAGTAGSGIFRSYDNGNNWTKIKSTSDTSHYVRAIIFDKDDNMFVSIDYEGIYFSSNSGDTWTNIGLTNFTIINSLAITIEGFIFAGTQDKGLWRTGNNGFSWDSLIVPSVIIKSLMVNARGTIFAGNANGYIYRSFNKGNSWSGMLPQDNLFYSINEIIESEEGIIYVALNNNGPHLSKDFGNIWGPFTYGIGKRTIFSICKDSRDTLYCGTQFGIYKTVLDTTALTTPNPAYPPHNSQDMILNVPLIWYNCRSTEKNELVVSLNNTFTNIYQQEIITNNRYNLTDLNYNTNYYWKVRSINNADTTSWSQSYQFTTKLNAPKLLSPINNSFNNDTIVELSWEYVVNSNQSFLQIAYDSSFSESSLIYSGITQTENSQTFHAECDKKYFWRIRVKNDYSESDWSSINIFSTKLSAPVNIYPEDSMANLSPVIKFEWEYNKNFSSYSIEIATDIDFSNVFFTDQNVSEANIEVDKFEYNTGYFWRVRVKSGAKISYWSDIFTFKTGASPPDLVTPENNSIGNPKEIVFEWNMGVLNDTIVLNGYLIEISKYEDFKYIIIEDSSLNDNSFQYNDFDYDTKYFWRVKANLNGHWTLFSDTWNFRIALSKPHTVFPENHSKNIEIPVTFIWKSPLDFDYFTLQVSDSSVFGKILIEKNNLTDTTFSIPELDYNTQYYWRIKYETDSNMSLWSDIRNFLTAKRFIEIPVLLFPPDSSIDCDTSLQLSWTDTGDSNTYYLQVSGNAEFDNCMVDIDSLTEREYFLTGIRYNKKYYWRVKAIRESNESNWSDIFSFKTKEPNGFDDYFPEHDNNLFDVDLFPIPLTDKLIILLNMKKELFVKISVFDLMGKSVIKSEDALLMPGMQEISLDMDTFNSGLYLLVLSSNGQIVGKMIVVDR